MRENLRAYIYGTLNYPVTAKEIEYAKKYLKVMHPNSPILAIDAAIGSPDDVGIIKVSNGGLYPGLGVDKNLGEIGDVSIIGIVAGKSNENYNLFNLTRLNIVYKMAEKIALGIRNYIDYISSISSLGDRNFYIN
jgi:putative sporulation protein YyaC